MSAPLAPHRSEATPVAATPRARVASIDLVRGMIMVIMALDHTRDFFGIPGQNPVDLTTASAPLFLTRWITFFCAPVFFLLMGTAAYLARGRRGPAELSGYLLRRGLWLIVLEVVVLRVVGYQFNADFRVTMLLVLWALGWSLIALALLSRLPVFVTTAVGVLMIVGHNLFDGVRSASPLWAILHAPGFVVNTPEHVVFAAYPLVPWIGVTAAGFGLGQVYGWDGDRRRAFLRRLGLALTVAFVVIRGLNVYGDPSPWTSLPAPGFTLLSFLNVTKYPPSLLFLLMTLGPALLVLAAVDRHAPRLLRPVNVIGTVPLFYYVLHFALIHLLAVATCLVRYGSAYWMFQSPDLANYPFTPPPGWGYSLPVVYGVWAGVVLATYPLCAWFAAIKRRHRQWWLSYL
ncbi:MAG TPA: heparan-alpha-glucosaminide N-acetyltransferase domain-containing protein [Gemmatimonadales bacterium]|nr:heparan-alpha-glucosaminide N-acetyltransferase domain-containing protein [Gemmatimonadales bacterium]